MRSLEESDSQGQEVGRWVPGAGELVFNGDRVSVWEDEQVLGMDGGEGNTTMRMC